MGGGRAGSATATEAAAALAQWIGTKPDADADRKVAALEARLRLTFPDDFRAYLLEASPKADRDDPHEICWWSLDRIQSVPEEFGAPTKAMARALSGESGKYVLFADYMGGAYAWAICCSDGPKRGQIVLICVGVDRIVAPSFSDFVPLAIADSPLIHLTDEAEALPRLTPSPRAKRLTVLRFFLYLPLVMLVSAAAAFLAIWSANNLR